MCVVLVDYDGVLLFGGGVVISFGVCVVLVGYIVVYLEISVVEGVCCIGGNIVCLLLVGFDCVEKYCVLMVKWVLLYWCVVIM